MKKGKRQIIEKKIFQNDDHNANAFTASISNGNADIFKDVKLDLENQVYGEDNYSQNLQKEVPCQENNEPKFRQQQPLKSQVIPLPKPIPKPINTSKKDKQVQNRKVQSQITHPSVLKEESIKIYENNQSINNIKPNDKSFLSGENDEIMDDKKRKIQLLKQKYLKKSAPIQNSNANFAAQNANKTVSETPDHQKARIQQNYQQKVKSKASKTELMPAQYYYNSQPVRQIEQTSAQPNFLTHFGINQQQQREQKNEEYYHMNNYEQGQQTSNIQQEVTVVAELNKSPQIKSRIPNPPVRNSKGKVPPPKRIIIQPKAIPQPQENYESNTMNHVHNHNPNPNIPTQPIYDSVKQMQTPETNNKKVRFQQNEGFSDKSCKISIYNAYQYFLAEKYSSLFIYLLQQKSDTLLSRKFHKILQSVNSLSTSQKQELKSFDDILSYSQNPSLRQTPLLVEMIKTFVLQNTCQISKRQQSLAHDILLQFFYSDPNNLNQLFFVILVKAGRQHLLNYQETIFKDQNSVLKYLGFLVTYQRYLLKQQIVCFLDFYESSLNAFTFASLNQEISTCILLLTVIQLSEAYDTKLYEKILQKIYNSAIFNQQRQRQQQTQQDFSILVLLTLISKGISKRSKIKQISGKSIHEVDLVYLKAVNNYLLPMISKIQVQNNDFSMLEIFLNQFKAIQFDQKVYAIGKDVKLKIIKEVSLNQKRAKQGIKNDNGINSNGLANGHSHNQRIQPYTQTQPQQAYSANSGRFNTMQTTNEQSQSRIEQKTKSILGSYWNKAKEAVNTTINTLPNKIQAINQKTQTKVKRQEEADQQIVWDPVLNRYRLNGEVPKDQTQQYRKESQQNQDNLNQIAKKVPPPKPPAIGKRIPGNGGVRGKKPVTSKFVQGNDQEL